MADILEQQVALQALVDRLVAVGPPNWVQAYAAIEWKPELDTFASAIVTAINLGDGWAFDRLGRDAAWYELAAACREMYKPDPWTRLELTVAYDGAFSADLGYEQPTATAGFSPDVMERVEFYSERCVRERGPAVHAR